MAPPLENDWLFCLINTFCLLLSIFGGGSGIFPLQVLCKHGDHILELAALDMLAVC